MPPWKKGIEREGRGAKKGKRGRVKKGGRGGGNDSPSFDARDSTVGQGVVVGAGFRCCSGSGTARRVHSLHVAPRFPQDTISSNPSLTVQEGLGRKRGNEDRGERRERNGEQREKEDGDQVMRGESGGSLSRTDREEHNTAVLNRERRSD